MCVLHVSSLTDSFDGFLEKHPDLPVYQQHNKNESIGTNDEASNHIDYGFSCVVSDRDWSDYEGQLTDITSFLQVYKPLLMVLQQSHQIDDIRFDIPLESPLNDSIHFHSFYLPNSLISLLNETNIHVEYTIYWPNDDKDGSA